MSNPRMLCACGCGRFRVTVGRGLAKPCWEAAKQVGTLDRYPFLNVRRWGDMVTEARFLMSQGLSLDEVQARLGYANLRSFKETLRQAEREGYLGFWERKRWLAR